MHVHCRTDRVPRPGQDRGSHQHCWRKPQPFLDRAEDHMNFIIWIIIGGVIGWLASMVMKTDAQQGIFLNIVVGIVGAFLGGWLLGPLFGTGTINSDNFSLASLLVSFLGAVILLGIVNLLRRGKMR
jgi:uncharacterized membrane protein YeaQ/YmgE (transglycosylase-associated protein family)